MLEKLVLLLLILVKLRLGKPIHIILQTVTYLTVTQESLKKRITIPFVCLSLSLNLCHSVPSPQEGSRDLPCQPAVMLRHDVHCNNHMKVTLTCKECQVAKLWFWGRFHHRVCLKTIVSSHNVPRVMMSLLHDIVLGMLCAMTLPSSPLPPTLCWHNQISWQPYSAIILS